MIRIFMFIAALFMVSASNVHAAQELAVDLAQEQVDITTGFNGETLVLFGTHKPNTEILVVLEGPRKDMAVRKKNQTLGMWMNTARHVFKDVPSFYSYAQGSYNDDDGEYTVPKKIKKRHKISSEYFVPRPDSLKDNDDKFKLFKESFIRNQRDAGMYPEAPVAIDFVSERLFRAAIYIPSNVPKGEYKVMSYMLDGDTVLETAQTRLKVAQVGRGAQVHNFAKGYGFVYGILCICLALLAGWGINAVRKN